MIAPMLSKATDLVPSSKDYIYEIKLDGQRTIAEVGRKSLLLYTRSFQKVTERYPELNELHECLQGKTAILDGEIVALLDGIPSFGLLQQRMGLRPGMQVIHMMQQVPILYYAFDILQYNGKSLLRTPLIERKDILVEVLAANDTIKILPHFDSRDRTIRMAREYGYEGVVAKKKQSPYISGQRTDFWLKQKFEQVDSFVIAGWMEGGRSRKFGALLVAKYNKKNLQYVGRVGTGFNDAMIKLLLEAFEDYSCAKAMVVDPPRFPGKVHWLKPQFVADVKFREWTFGEFLRAPVFTGLRTDLRPLDCKL
jgi:bifunctional non-homologous end joining protein LigD